jgi:hypothetical protein
MKTSFLVLSLFFAIITVQSQTYEPSTKWPYLYENFSNGVIYFSNNTKVNASVNVHLVQSSLHYLKGELIFQVEPKDLIRVEIGNDAFIYIDNQLSRIVNHQANNLLIIVTKVDFDAMAKPSGAYGMSTSSSATRDLSSLEISGLTNNNHRKMLIEKEEGKSLPLKVDYYFVIDNKTINASKKNMEKELNPELHAKFKIFLKQNKMKWRNEEHLINLLRFLVSI